MRYASARGVRGFEVTADDNETDIDTIVSRAIFALACSAQIEPGRARRDFCASAWKCMHGDAQELATMYLCMAARPGPCAGRDPCVMPRAHDFVVAVRIAYETGCIQLAIDRLPAWRPP